MERAGQALDRVAGVFYNLTGSHTNPDLQAIERQVGPKLSRHGSAIYLNPRLWARISAVDADAENLGPEERRVLDRYRIRFRRAGAELAPRRRSGWRPSRSACPNSRRSSARTCWRTRAASPCP